MSFSISTPADIQNLLSPAAFDNYGRSAGDAGIHDKLEGLTPSVLFEKPLTDNNMAKCCLSGLWLLHNFLDESHSISQNVNTAEGSFWHAIMHRMEGDFSNSKYWYRKVGPHPVFQTMTAILGSEWDPYDFVDRCQAESRQQKLITETQKLSVIEWQSLFKHCHDQASSLSSDS